MSQVSLDFYKKKRNYKDLNSILITGTKGKTSVSLMLNHIFDFAKKSTLYVSTSGVYRNKKRIADYKASLSQFGFAPTVMPGRYIYFLLKNGLKTTDFTAILESSLSCGIFGTGLYEHKVGALLNIYTDHIDGSLIKNRQDLYKMKSFIFNDLVKNGYYVANLDNDLSRQSLREPILLTKKIRKIAFTKTPMTSQRAKKLAKDLALKDLFYTTDNQVYCVSKGLIYDFSDFPYLQVFAHHQALKANILAVLAIASNYFSYDLIKKALTSFRFPFEFGRMMLFEKEETKQKIIIDFAHEPVSLKLMIANLKDVYGENPYLITRLATSKTNKTITKLSGGFVKLDLSGLTIYDLMSSRQQPEMNLATFSRKSGEVADLVAGQLQKNSPPFPYQVTYVETEALQAALDSDQKLILHIHSNMKQLKTFIDKNSLCRLL